MILFLFYFKICTLPQLILSLRFSYVDISLKWLLRLNISANLIIYIPQSVTFFSFIFNSHLYWNIFKQQSIFDRLLSCIRNNNNRIAPLTIAHIQLHKDIEHEKYQRTNGIKTLTQTHL
jgi:hypothetical protein